MARLVRFLDALAPASAGSVSERPCAGAAELLDTTGIAVAVASAGSELLTVGRTDSCGSFDRLRSDVGKGPAWAGHRGALPVIVSDLRQDDQWPAFGPAAADLGVHAVYSFTLRRGSARIWTLTLYRRVVGGLTDDEHADAVGVARVAGDVVLASQAGRRVDELRAISEDGGHDEAAIQ